MSTTFPSRVVKTALAAALGLGVLGPGLATSAYAAPTPTPTPRSTPSPTPRPTPADAPSPTATPKAGVTATPNARATISMSNAQFDPPTLNAGAGQAFRVSYSLGANRPSSGEVRLAGTNVVGATCTVSATGGASVNGLTATWPKGFTSGTYTLDCLSTRTPVSGQVALTATSDVATVRIGKWTYGGQLTPPGEPTPSAGAVPTPSEAPIPGEMPTMTAPPSPSEVPAPSDTPASSATPSEAVTPVASPRAAADPTATQSPTVTQPTTPTQPPTEPAPTSVQPVVAGEARAAATVGFGDLAGEPPALSLVAGATFKVTAPVKASGPTAGPVSTTVADTYAQGAVTCQTTADPSAKVTTENGMTTVAWDAGFTSGQYVLACTVHRPLTTVSGRMSLTAPQDNLDPAAAEWSYGGSAGSGATTGDGSTAGDASGQEGRATGLPATGK